MMADVSMFTDQSDPGLRGFTNFTSGGLLPTSYQILQEQESSPYDVKRKYERRSEQRPNVGFAGLSVIVWGQFTLGMDDRSVAPNCCRAGFIHTANISSPLASSPTDFIATLSGADA